jgi:hypothetical protein
MVSLNSEEAQKDQYMGKRYLGMWIGLQGAKYLLGLSLREMIHEFKHQTLVLFKCLLLEPKVNHCPPLYLSISR